MDAVGEAAKTLRHLSKTITAEYLVQIEKVFEEQPGLVQDFWLRMNLYCSTDFPADALEVE